MNPLASFDAEAKALADKLNRRWRAEVKLLAAIASAPRYRWNCVARRAGVTLDDFSWPDCFTIAEAIDLASPYTNARTLCCTLASLLLKDRGQWDEHDPRPFVTGTRWNYPELVHLFTVTLGSFNEIELVTTAMAEVRSLPELKSFDGTRRAT